VFSLLTRSVFAAGCLPGKFNIHCSPSARRLYLGRLLFLLLEETLSTSKPIFVVMILRNLRFFTFISLAKTYLIIQQMFISLSTSSLSTSEVTAAIGPLLESF